MNLLLTLFPLACSFTVAVCMQWRVHYPPRVIGLQNSCVLIPCSFDYPNHEESGQLTITGIWYHGVKQSRVTVYHSRSSTQMNSAYVGRTEIIGDLSRQNCTFKIQNLQLSDQGKYFFRFEIREIGNWEDVRGIILNVTQFPQKPTVRAVTEVMELESVSATCSTPYNCPENPSRLRWLGINMDSPESTVKSCSYNGTSSLEVSFVSSHLDHNLVLTCVVTVDGLHLSSHTEITLRVKHLAKNVTVLVFPHAEPIEEGSAVALFCDTSSSEPGVSAYSWYKDGQALAPGKILRFDSVRTQDGGMYYCSARNELGQVASHNISLIVLHRNSYQINHWRTAVLWLIGIVSVCVCAGIALCLIIRYYRNQAIMRALSGYRGSEIKPEQSPQSWSFHELESKRRNFKGRAAFKQDPIKNVDSQSAASQVPREDNQLISLS